MDVPKAVRYFVVGGILYLATQYGCSTVRYIWRVVSKVTTGKTPIKDMQIHLASTEEESDDYVVELERQGLEDGFLGFDCEWVNNEPVALVQISTKDGYCVMFHLSKMQSFPLYLKDLLENDNILKVGVSPQNDAKLLFRDYQVCTQGCTDVRFFAPIREKMGLAALANDHLNISLNKSSHIRRSDWSADTLSQEQLWYAGFDAYVGALLFAKLTANTPKENIAVYIGRNFKGSHNVENKSSQRVYGKVNDSTCSSGNNLAERKAMRAYTPRKTPIYSNCKMLAPDGEILCTCSRKKANWYLIQGLAKEISVDPYQIQLLFEPASRFRSPSGLYYIQDKVNQCVVCGKKDSHLRKNVVPHEYRRHFPDAMKKHQSHDVLPLCQLCHLKSNNADISLRQKLAVECNALIGVGNDVKATDDGRLKKLRSAARALLYGDGKISENRRQELVNTIYEELPYYEEQLKLRTSESGESEVCGDSGVGDGTGYSDGGQGQGDGTGDNVTRNGTESLQSLQDLPLNDILPTLRNIDISVANDNYVPHGLKVTEQFSKDGIPGLMRLEKMWRQHFVEKMNPKFLPDLWSVSHFHHNEKVFAEDEAFKTKMQKIKTIEQDQA